MADIYLELDEADLETFGQLDRMCCELGRVYDADCLDAKKLAPLVASHMDLRENLAEMLRNNRELSLDEICN